LLDEQVAFLEPNEANFLRVGVLALNLGDNKLAQQYLDRVKTADGYFQLGNAYFLMNKYDLAATSYQKAIDKKQNATYYAGLGRSLLKTGNLENAKSALESSYKLEATPEIGYLYILAGGQENKFTTLANQIAGYNVSRETDPANKAILVYNALENLGYPQAAIKTIDNASLNGTLGRDGLIELAKCGSLIMMTMVHTHFYSALNKLILIIHRFINN
jgi:tetratricopeptide (TPR) repeat protein